MNSEERQKKLEEIRRKIKSGEMKVVMAPDDQVSLLRNWVDQVLGAIAEETGNPRIAGALVSDESHISDFSSKFSDEEYEPLVQRVAEKLGIEIANIKEDGYIVAMAQKLAKGE